MEGGVVEGRQGRRRTPGVEGEIVVDGAEVAGGQFVVDMRGLIADSGARTGAIRNQAFPTAVFELSAVFELTAPLDFGQIRDEGEQFTVTAAGNLTVHGVTQAVEMPPARQLGPVSTSSWAKRDQVGGQCGAGISAPALLAPPARIERATHG